MSQITPTFSISLTLKGRIALISTLWNEVYCLEQLRGANHVFSQFEFIETDAFQVPGCIELVYACQQLVKSGKYDAIIAYGIVIKGETLHFDYVCNQMNSGLSLLNATQGIPIIYGVLTVLNKEQVEDRLGGKHGHKGEEAAFSALQMMAFKKMNI